ncbi:hypothetical protein Btru_072108 [Bulinus truncatus]|nr:hypothetical protein Btru_072108 [Bulinus truncatus]
MVWQVYYLRRIVPVKRYIYTFFCLIKTMACIQRNKPDVALQLMTCFLVLRLSTVNEHLPTHASDQSIPNVSTGGGEPLDRPEQDNGQIKAEHRTMISALAFVQLAFISMLYIDG